MSLTWGEIKWGLEILPAACNAVSYNVGWSCIVLATVAKNNQRPLFATLLWL